jgi:protein gp37
MGKSKIEWTEHSWNPLKVREGGPFGCTKVSPGCLNCYASSMNHRFGGRAFNYTRKPDDFYLDQKVLEAPIRAKNPHTYFVCSMTDLFHERVHPEKIEDVLQVMCDCEQHTFQVLTKRPDEMRILLDMFYADREIQLMSHVWCGTTCEDQEWADKRIPYLLATHAAVRWLSIEPMIGPITLPNPTDWVVVGAESGSKRRECKLEWVRSVVAQCQAVNVPVFVKQLQINGKLTKDIADFPEDLRIREYPVDLRGQK